MVIKPDFGNWTSISILDSLEKFVLITMEEPLKIIKPKISNEPTLLIFNKNMSVTHLDILFSSLQSKMKEGFTIVGLGGGTACDTAKYINWKLKEKLNLSLDLILIPSIISVDAFLCSSSAVRIDNKVKYIGESIPNKIIIDYELIKLAPEILNRAGVSDTISITSALGDWKIERDEINGRFDLLVFNNAKKIALDLMHARFDIRDVTKKGVDAIVNGFYKEVKLCEEWGNARPEEGSEHFLAYCLEAITGDHYIHGNLIGMNILISLFLQGVYAEFSLEEIKQFFEDIKITINPKHQNISYSDIKKALKNIQKFVIEEELQYSIYNSPNLKLDKNKIEEIIQFVRNL